MITLYSGIPGSGKSYKMVYDLNDLHNKFYVVHNVDGLKPDLLGDYGVNFISYCETEGMLVEDFFSKEYQIKFTEAVREKYSRNVLVVIDEAQEWFDKNKKNLKMWLSYHRHLNQEIWLVAHRSTNLPSIYRSFIEVEYRAKSGSILSIPGYFLYNRIVAGERVGYIFAKKKKEIFSLYRSQVEGFKKRRPSLLLPGAAFFIIAAVAYFFIIPQKVISKSPKASASTGSASSVPAAVLKTLPSSGNSVDLSACRFVGRIGKELILEDSKFQIFRLSDVPEKYAILEVAPSFLKLYDVSNHKELYVRFENPASVARRNTEAGHIEAGRIKESSL